MTDINKLISTYYTNDGENITATPKKDKRECYTKKYQQQQRLESNRKNRHLLLDQLLNEITFHLSKSQIEQIRFWIDIFNPYWKQLHRQASNETIILAMIMIQRKHLDTRLKIERYPITHKYNLTNSKFITIQNQLIALLMRTTPLTYNQSTRYNHEILEKGKY